MFGNGKISPELLMGLGGGILSGANLGQGLGAGFTNASGILSAQKQQQQAQELRNKTADMLQTVDPEIAEMVRAGAVSVTNGYQMYLDKKKAAEAASRPDYQFMDVNGKIVRMDKNAGTFDQLADYSQPKTSAEYQDFLLQKDNPDYANFRQAEIDAKKAPSAKDNFESEQTLWKNWRSDADVKEYQGVRNGYEKIRTSAIDPSGPKDLGIIFGYMKMLDPTSVVREGEQASVANSGGVPQQVISLYNRVLTGEKLPEQVRMDIISAADGIYQESAKNYEAVNNQVRNMAERYNVDPQFITPAEKYEPLKIGQKIETTVNGKKAVIERVSE